MRWISEGSVGGGQYAAVPNTDDAQAAYENRRGSRLLKRKVSALKASDFSSLTCEGGSPRSPGAILFNETNEAMSNPPPGVSPDEYQRHVACGKVMDELLLEEKGTCYIEHTSVYGAAVALPQFARTAGWSVHFMALAIRSYLFLVVNILIQGFLLYMIAVEQRVNDKFLGQMALCNMGAGLPNCPGSHDCVGPAGTSYSPERLFNWETWFHRMFVKKSFAALFPDRIDDINRLLDPGEYGLESFWLRLTCCFLFVMGIWQDLANSVDLLYSLYNIPTADEAWVVHNPRKNGEEDILGTMKFRVAGMPLHWKIINVVCVVLPKLYIWLLMVDLGILFLMETAGLESMIMNTVALAFILETDELICATLFSGMAQRMLQRLEPLELFEPVGADNDMDVWERHQRNRQTPFCSFKVLVKAFPKRLFGIVLITAFFHCKYYLEHCKQKEDGSWTGFDLHPPAHETLGILSFLFGPVPEMFAVPVRPEIWWSASSRNNVSVSDY